MWPEYFALLTIVCCQEKQSCIATNLVIKTYSRTDIVRQTNKQTEVKSTFQVTMDDAVTMKECQTEYDLSSVVGDDQWVEGSKVM